MTNLFTQLQWPDHNIVAYKVLNYVKSAIAENVRDQVLAMVWNQINHNIHMHVVKQIVDNIRDQAIEDTFKKDNL